MSSDGIESAFDPEPDLPMAFVPCRGCGELVPLQAAECEHCGAARPRELVDALPSHWPTVATECARCGDVDGGPWLVKGGDPICEPCDDAERRAS